ncbi:MAG: glycosyl hydrolase, partial [Gemmatimonadetes bacterium]|nr:glycosyl hydrolase [Gemmatimonadota bacterium]
LMRRISGADEEMDRVRERLRHMRAALVETPRADPALFARLDELGRALSALEMRLSGDPARQRLDEATAPSIRGRVGQVIGGHWGTRQAPTVTQRRNIEIASGDFAGFSRDLATLIESDLAQLEQDLAAAGAPWTPGRRVGNRG